MLKKISGDDKDLYELRSGQTRIAAYLDREVASFVLLSGWLKKRRQAGKDIEQARRWLREYVAGHEGGDHGSNSRR
ncbi:MAG: hypothetical protein HYX92_20400 [Chloroflexi bacterium]|nr:hypothetical protein [Chloroflexota bacterium]